MTTEYLVKPASSPTWHQVKACISPSIHKADDGHRIPLLHYATIDGVIICSALDDHELILISEGGEIIRHYWISAREHFDREDLEAANA